MSRDEVYEMLGKLSVAIKVVDEIGMKLLQVAPMIGVGLGEAYAKMAETRGLIEKEFIH